MRLAGARSLRGTRDEGSPRQRAERAAEYWRDPEVDACPIFVEYRRKVSLLGVPRGFTCARLRAVFDAQFGPVAVAEVIDSKLAYITFWEAEHAAAAVQTNVVFERADGDDWEVQPRYHERKNDDARRGTCANLFIGNLPYDVTDATFQQLIEPFSVTGVRRVPEKGIAFVTLDSATRSRPSNGVLTSLKSVRVFGRAIRVDYDEHGRNPRPTRQPDTRSPSGPAKEEARRVGNLRALGALAGGGDFARKGRFFFVSRVEAEAPRNPGRVGEFSLMSIVPIGRRTAFGIAVRSHETPNGPAHTWCGRFEPTSIL